MAKDLWSRQREGENGSAAAAAAQRHFSTRSSKLQRNCAVFGGERESGVLEINSTRAWTIIIIIILTKHSTLERFHLPHLFLPPF